MIRDGIRRVFDLALRRRDRWEREVEEEIKLHLSLRAEQLAAMGMSPDEAYQEALRRFGPLSESRSRLLDAAQHRETRMQRTEFLSDARQDLTFAVRTLGRQKAWTAITIATLALGIGATTAVFSVVSSLLLHPLPYPNSNRVVYVDQQPTNGNNTGVSVSVMPGASLIRAWRENSHSFEALEPQNTQQMPLKTTTGDPSSVRSTAVLPSFAQFAGVRPILGRMFSDNDIRGVGRVAVLNEGFWRERLGASRDVLGRLLTLGDSTYAVIGVMPASLTVGGPGARPTDVWLPFDLRNKDLGAQVIGRLKPGVSIEAAQRELDLIAARVHGSDQTPATNTTTGDESKEAFTTVVSWPAQRLRFRESLLFLTAAVGLVLLVACMNVAHLLLARSATRQREMAVRAALGAGGGRLFRQLLTESLVLAGTGAALGVAVGWAMLQTMIAMRPSSRPELGASHLDLTTLALILGVALLSGVVFGVLGAVQSSRSSTHDSLKAGSLAVSGGRAHTRIRSLLVVSEMALSAMLIVGAALVVRSLANLQHTDLGFDPRGLYALDLVPRAGSVTARDAAVLDEFAERVRHLPGVRAVTTTRAAPGWRFFAIGHFEIEGESPPPKSATSFIDIDNVRTDYFSTMGIRFREGSGFRDTTPAAHEVIVNAGFATAHWQPGKAVGHRIRIAQTDSEPWLTIVGVVNDALTTGPLNESRAPFLYTPLDTNRLAKTVMVRVDGGAAALKPAVEIGHQLGMRNVTIDGTEAFIYSSLSEPRFVTLIMSAFGLLGLVLAAVGLFGVMSYTVAQQTREIGIRVALGASSAHVVERVLARGTTLALTGALLGLAFAGWGTKLIASQLHGVERVDPVSFVVGATVLIGAALLACIVPARRALRVDPVTAIRAE